MSSTYKVPRERIYCNVKSNRSNRNTLQWVLMVGLLLIRFWPKLWRKLVLSVTVTAGLYKCVFTKVSSSDKEEAEPVIHSYTQKVQVQCKCKKVRWAGNSSFTFAGFLPLLPMKLMCHWAYWKWKHLCNMDSRPLRSPGRKHFHTLYSGIFMVIM